jgi:hypothetical protein
MQEDGQSLYSSSSMASFTKRPGTILVRIKTSISHRSRTGGKSGYLKRIVRIRLKVSQLVRAKPCAELAPKSRDAKWMEGDSSQYWYPYNLENRY